MPGPRQDPSVAGSGEAARAGATPGAARPGLALGLAVLLFGLTLALFWPTVSFDFLNYDDDVYVTRNAIVRRGLTAEGVRWAFTSDHAANWHPLTWLSHMLDVTLFGTDAGAHHRTNAVLHASNAALLLLALFALTRAVGPSLVCAALFAWHPLRVESVAWIAERKDVLAGTFWLLTMLLYAGWTRRGGWARYGGSLACFALGLMAKPMLVTLPFVLLLLDAWPLGRFAAPSAAVLPSPAPAHPLGSTPGRTPGRRRGFVLFAEKIPFLALTVASAVCTALVQRAGGAIGPLEAFTLKERLANALASYAVYVVKFLAPSGLSPFHLHPALAPDFDPWSGATLGAASFLLAISALAFLARRRAPAIAVGWLWFLGTLVPVIGLVQVGLQAWAERYSYLPSIGLGIALVFGAQGLVRSERLRRALFLPALLALAACAFLTRRQLGAWRDSASLFAHALAQDPENFVALTNLGQALEARGELDAAAEQYLEALRLRPHLAPVRTNLGRLRASQERFEEALAELERAVATDPLLPDAHAALGWTLFQVGRDDEALEHLRRATELAPGEPTTANALAWVLATSAGSARPEQALAIAERLCRATRHEQPGFVETLAAALARLGRFDEAVAWQERALASVPESARALLETRLALYRAGQPFVHQPRNRSE